MLNDDSDLWETRIFVVDAINKHTVIKSELLDNKGGIWISLFYAP